MKIAIIGAGVAGLSAAYHLLQDDKNSSEITIYEASNRVGGRIWSYDIPGYCKQKNWFLWNFRNFQIFLDATVDLGAFWIHMGTHKKHPVGQFCRENGIAMRKHPRNWLTGISMLVGVFRFFDISRIYKFQTSRHQKLASSGQSLSSFQGENSKFSDFIIRF